MLNTLWRGDWGLAMQCRGWTDSQRHERSKPLTSHLKTDPTLLLGFDSAAAAPLSSYDLLAIGPFVVAAVVVAGVRKVRRLLDR